MSQRMWQILQRKGLKGRIPIVWITLQILQMMYQIVRAEIKILCFKICFTSDGRIRMCSSHISRGWTLSEGTIIIHSQFESTSISMSIKVSQRPWQQQRTPLTESSFHNIRLGFTQVSQDTESEFKPVLSLWTETKYKHADVEILTTEMNNWFHKLTC